MLNLKLKGKDNEKLKRKEIIIGEEFFGYLLEPLRKKLEEFYEEKELCYVLNFSEVFEEEEVHQITRNFVYAFGKKNSLGLEPDRVFTDKTITGLPPMALSRLMNYIPKVEKIEVRVKWKGKEYTIC